MRLWKCRIRSYRFTNARESKKGRGGGSKDNYANVSCSGDGGFVHGQEIDAEYGCVGVGMLSLLFGVSEGLF